MPEAKEKSFPFLSPPPHIKAGDSIKKIMWTFTAVLMLICSYSIYIFGLHTALIFAVCVVSGVSAEAAFQLLVKRKIKVTDGSSVITGLLVGMNVPPHSPLWMCSIGTVFAVVIVKEFFGGLGFNIFNPALAGRAFMSASWPAYMATNWHIFPSGSIYSEKLTMSGSIPQGVLDVITQATPLTAFKEGGKLLREYNLPMDTLYDLFVKNNTLKSLMTGNTGGCTGEVSALLLLAGGIFLMSRKIITWQIPVSFIGSVAMMSYFYYSYIGISFPGFASLIHILSGGLLLGAFFMATDMVTTPLSAAGMVIFGTGCGLITFAIRILGGYPEGVCYAILIMNAAVPLIDNLTSPAVFGITKKSI